MHAAITWVLDVCGFFLRNASSLVLFFVVFFDMFVSFDCYFAVFSSGILLIFLYS